MFEQLFGIIGFLLCILRMQMKSKEGFMAMNALINAIFGIQYMILAAPIGIIISFSAAARSSLLLTKIGQKFKNTIVTLATGSIVVMGVYTLEVAAEILFLLPPFLYAYAEYQHSQFVLRTMVLIAAVIMLVYSVVVFNIGGIMSGIANIGSNLAGFARFHIKDIKLALTNPLLFFYMPIESGKNL